MPGDVTALPRSDAQPDRPKTASDIKIQPTEGIKVLMRPIRRPHYDFAETSTSRQSQSRSEVLSGT
jgi:hypothetical protein